VDKDISYGSYIVYFVDTLSVLYLFNDPQNRVCKKSSHLAAQNKTKQINSLWDQM